jgi:hypothetical protein
MAKRIAAWIGLIALFCVCALPCFAANVETSVQNYGYGLGICAVCDTAKCTTTLEMPLGIRPLSILKKVNNSHYLVKAICPNCGATTEDVNWMLTCSDGYNQSACEHREYGVDNVFAYQDFYVAVCHNCSAMHNWESVKADLITPDYSFTVKHQRDVAVCQGRSHI